MNIGRFFLKKGYARYVPEVNNMAAATKDVLGFFSHFQGYFYFNIFP